MTRNPVSAATIFPRDKWNVILRYKVVKIEYYFKHFCMSTEAKTLQCEMHNEIMATDKFLD